MENFYSSEIRGPRIRYQVCGRRWVIVGRSAAFYMMSRHLGRIRRRARVARYQGRACSVAVFLPICCRVDCVVAVAAQGREQLGENGAPLFLRLADHRFVAVVLSCCSSG